MPQNKLLTGHEIAEFEELEAEAKSQWNLLKPKLEVLCAIAKRIKDGRLYLARFHTYEEFSQTTFGRSAKALDSMMWREEKKAQAKAAINPPKLLETRNANLEYVGTETESEDKPMSGARQCGETEMRKPAPFPVPVVNTIRPVPVPLSVADKVNEIVREALRLQGPNCAMAFYEPPFRHLLAQLVGLQKLVQPSLPGMDEHFANPPEPAVNKARCTEAEAKAYCVSLGLPESDGAWFYAKMEGAADKRGNWLNGGKPVRNCYQTMKAWELAGYMASQKRKVNERNAAPEQKNHVSQQLDRDLSRLRKGLI